MKKTNVLVAAALMLLGATAWAATEPTSQATIRETTDKVLEVLRKEGGSLKDRPERLYQIIDELILPHFDFLRMSKWVLGRHWAKATEAQQGAFAHEFQALLVRSYARALVDYRNQEVEFISTTERAPDDVTIRAKIKQPGGPSVPVTYQMHLNDGHWKVYDVSVDGVSLVINYRSSFNQEIRRNGIDGLIERLSKHNAPKN